jgi:hypothetical protein
MLKATNKGENAPKGRATAWGRGEGARARAQDVGVGRKVVSSACPPDTLPAASACPPPPSTHKTLRARKQRVMEGEGHRLLTPEQGAPSPHTPVPLYFARRAGPPCRYPNRQSRSPTPPMRSRAGCTTHLLAGRLAPGGLAGGLLGAGLVRARRERGCRGKQHQAAGVKGCTHPHPAPPTTHARARAPRALTRSTHGAARAAHMRKPTTRTHTAGRVGWGRCAGRGGARGREANAGRASAPHHGGQLLFWGGFGCGACAFSSNSLPAPESAAHKLWGKLAGSASIEPAHFSGRRNKFRTR